MRTTVHHGPSALRRCALAGAALTFAFGVHAVSLQAQNRTIGLEVLDSYESGHFNEGGAEIGAFDPKTDRIFVTNAEDNSLDVIDASDPSDLSLDFTIDLSGYGGGPNSVAVHKKVVAVAVQANDKTDNGSVVFFKNDGTYITQVEVGALPDMLTFTPDGTYLLVANEGEPNDDYDVDPEGTVSLIDMRGKVKDLTNADVRTVSFTDFNGATLDAGIRIFGPGASVAQDLEPEYIAVSEDSRKAWVTLQENNAIAEIDIRSGAVTSLFGLGFKDHSLQGNGIDASDRDDGINITTWPVFGMYMPDAIAVYRHCSDYYLVTANEGDARDYDGFAEEERVKDLDLDPTAFPNADDLQENENIGRLTVTTVNGDIDNDGDYDELYAFGARSFSIFDTDGDLVFDSGDDFEQITALLYEDDFNSNNDENGSFESRSDNKGPEPEGLAIGTVKGHTYAFIGLERMGGVMVYDITDPYDPSFVEYVNNRDFSGDAEDGTAGDLGPEGLLFVEKSKSPTNTPLLIVTNEISGTTTTYAVNTVRANNAKEVITAGEEATELASAPNPATGSATVTFATRTAGPVRLEIVDVIGTLLTTPVDEQLDAGRHEIAVDVSAVAPGTYFYRVVSNGHVIAVRPMQIVR